MKGISGCGGGIVGALCIRVVSGIAIDMGVLRSERAWKDIRRRHSASR